MFKLSLLIESKNDVTKEKEFSKVRDIYFDSWLCKKVTKYVNGSEIVLADVTATSYEHLKQGTYFQDEFTGDTFILSDFATGVTGLLKYFFIRKRVKLKIKNKD